VENVQTTNQNENEGNFEGEDGWNGYILLNENEPAQPDDNDTEFMYALLLIRYVLNTKIFDISTQVSEIIKII